MSLPPSNGKDKSGENVQLKKGQWTAEEDAILAAYVQKHGGGNWNEVQKQTGLPRCGKSCRLRWTNHLRPDLKKGPFTLEERDKVIALHAKFGNKWSQMVQELPGRTDNEIKNFWNTRKKKFKRCGIPLYPPEIKPQLLNDNQENPSGSAQQADISPEENMDTPELSFNVDLKHNQEHEHSPSSICNITESRIPEQDSELFQFPTLLQPDQLDDSDRLDNCLRSTSTGRALPTLIDNHDMFQDGRFSNDIACSCGTPSMFRAIEEAQDGCLGNQPAYPLPSFDESFDRVNQFEGDYFSSFNACSSGTSSMHEDMSSELPPFPPIIDENLDKCWWWDPSASSLLPFDQCFDPLRLPSLDESSDTLIQCPLFEETQLAIPIQCPLVKETQPDMPIQSPLVEETSPRRKLEPLSNPPKILDDSKTSSMHQGETGLDEQGEPNSLNNENSNSRGLTNPDDLPELGCLNNDILFEEDQCVMKYILFVHYWKRFHRK